MPTEDTKPDLPQIGATLDGNGHMIYWTTNEKGSRVYSTDKETGGVQVWDTSRVSIRTLQDAIYIEHYLLGSEQRNAS